jgi:RNA polymerase sigma-70 factor (ECF subfamily)
MSDPAQDDQDRLDMARLAAGHDTALNDLMQRHSQKLFHYLRRHLPNDSDAEDCAQEAFVRVYVNRGKFRPASKFTTWLYAIATNLARDCHRRHTRHPEVALALNEDGTGGMGAIPDKTPLAGEQMENRERAEQVRAAVQALPEDLRTPLLLFEYENLGQAEIGEILDCTPKAVELRIYRARKILRESLAGLMDEPG